MSTVLFYLRIRSAVQFDGDESELLTWNDVDGDFFIDKVVEPRAELAAGLLQQLVVVHLVIDA